MNLQDLIERQKERIHQSSVKNYSASFRNAFPYRLCAHSWAASNFRLRLDGLAGVTINFLPSVLTSSGVSGSIFNNSRIGRSITNARLFPCRVSFLTIFDSVLPMYHHSKLSRAREEARDTLLPALVSYNHKQQLTTLISQRRHRIDLHGPPCRYITRQQRHNQENHRDAHKRCR